MFLSVSLSVELNYNPAHRSLHKALPSQFFPPSFSSAVTMTEFWLISAPGEKTCQQTWDKMMAATTRTNNLSANHKFNIPDLKVSTDFRGLLLCSSQILAGTYIICGLKSSYVCSKWNHSPYTVYPLSRISWLCVWEAAFAQIRCQHVGLVKFSSTGSAQLVWFGFSLSLCWRWSNPADLTATRGCTALLELLAMHERLWTKRRHAKHIGPPGCPL